MTSFAFTIFTIHQHNRRSGWGNVPEMAELEVLFLNLNFFRASLTSAGISTVAFDYLSAHSVQYGLTIVVLFLSDMTDYRLDLTTSLGLCTLHVTVRKWYFLSLRVLENEYTLKPV
jgi:hypothetical protein